MPTQESEKGGEKSGGPREVWEESGNAPKGSGRVGRPIWRPEMGREAHSEVQDGSGGVGWPIQRSGSGQKAHPEVWEESGFQPGGSGGY